MGSYIPGSGVPPQRTLILSTPEMADLSPGPTRGQERFYCFTVRLVSHDVILLRDLMLPVFGQAFRNAISSLLPQLAPPETPGLQTSFILSATFLFFMYHLIN